jgi:hypothetical protein
VKILLMAILLALLQYLIGEVLAGFDVVARWLIRRTAARMPVEHRERYRDEWLAEAIAIPGAGLWRLLFALRLRSTMRVVRRELTGEHPSSRVAALAWRVVFAGFACALLVITAPLSVTLGLALRVTEGGPVIGSRRVTAHNGRRVTIYHFNATSGTPLGKFVAQTDLDMLPGLVTMAAGRVWPTWAELRAAYRSVAADRRRTK